MMTKDEARKFQADHGADARALSRQTRALLEQIGANRGLRIAPGHASTKGELVQEILLARYPISRLNESIHVLYHDGAAWDGCTLCVPGLAAHAAAGVEAIAEASQ